MENEVRFERSTKTNVIGQLQDVRKEIAILKRRQEKILQILEEYELTEDAKKDLKEARDTPEENYISHENVKKRLESSLAP